MFPFVDDSKGVGLVSCDWFAMSCLLANPRDARPLVAPQGWSCLLMSPTSVWAERWFVLDGDGNKVATILCSPRSSIIDARRCVVEIANRWLYFDDFHIMVDLVCGILPMSIEGLNRVDLCCDFEMTAELYDVYKKLADGSAYIKALRSGAVFWQDVNAGSLGMVRVPHCLNFGGFDSTFKWKVYWKFLELEQAPPEGKKPYIVDMWKNAGFSEKQVWRVEVSIKDTNSLRNMKQEKILPLQWWDERVSLFKSIYSDKFVVRENQGHADKRNDRILPFLEIVGEKTVRHALPSASRDDSDPERRTTCKLWRELTQGDTQCNRVLSRIIAETLLQLVQRPCNLWALERMYGVDIEIVSKTLSEAVA